MRVFIATDVTVFLDGKRILANQKHSTIFRRYYNAFGAIILCTRIKNCTVNEKDFDDISDIIEDTVEVKSLLKMLTGTINHKIESKIKKCDLIICRCPAISAYKAADIALKNEKPYLAESMGDAWDAYWNHGLLGKMIAPYMFMKMKKVVRHANYAVYVTSHYLQKRYPCDKGGIAASNVLIKESSKEALEKRILKIQLFDKKSISLMTTAAVDVWYKGHQYVIKAIPYLNCLGIKVKYRIVGEGDQTRLLKIAKEEGVFDQVEFLGRLPLEQVLELLDETDIYIQPSLQEGLPRSVIEAMSRGCACIGAKTAGIPELIEEKYVVRRKSIKGIVSLISDYIDLELENKVKLSVRNFKEAKKYEESFLNHIRTEYFRKIVNEINNI